MIDSQAYLFICDIDSFNNVLYDEKTGRIEIPSKGQYIYYSDYINQTIQDAGELAEGFIDVFYDYTDPSLYETLKSLGVQFKEGPIDFSILDSRI